MSTTAIESIENTNTNPTIQSESESALPDPSINPLFSNGLYSSISPSIISLDESISTVYQSQQSLANYIDQLNKLLLVFQSNTKSSQPIFKHYTGILQKARKRLKAISNNINTINNRLDETAALVKRKEGLNNINSNKSSAAPAAAPSTAATDPASVSHIEQLNNLLDWK